MNDEKRLKRLEIQRRYREKNREKLREAGRIYREKHKEEIYKRAKPKKSEYDRRYREKHSEELKKKKREYYEKNKETIVKNNTKRDKERKKNDTLYRMTKNLRTRLRWYLKPNSKSHTTKKLIGCSIDFYRKWISFQFDAYMNWDNYGLKLYWVIDHVKPMNLFNLNKEEEILKCMHWSNLRPFENIQNIKKSNNYTSKIKHLHNIVIKSFIILHGKNFKDKFTLCV